MFIGIFLILLFFIATNKSWNRKRLAIPLIFFVFCFLLDMYFALTIEDLSLFLLSYSFLAIFLFGIVFTMILIKYVFLNKQKNRNPDNKTNKKDNEKQEVA